MDTPRTNRLGSCPTCGAIYPLSERTCVVDDSPLRPLDEPEPQVSRRPWARVAWVALLLGGLAGAATWVSTATSGDEAPPSRARLDPTPAPSPAPATIANDAPDVADPAPEAPPPTPPADTPVPAPQEASAPAPAAEEAVPAPAPSAPTPIAPAEEAIIEPAEAATEPAEEAPIEAADEAAEAELAAPPPDVPSEADEPIRRSDLRNPFD